MKKLTFVLCFLVCTSGAVNAQFLNRLGKSVQNAAENATERATTRNVEKKVEKGVDDVFDGDSNKRDKPQKSEEGWECPECGTQNTGKFCSECGAKPVVGNQVASVVPKNVLETTYAKCDFVAGDEVFFEDNQANEQMGEFPSQWDMEQGNAEIVQFGGDKCIMLIGYTIITPLIGNGKNYLPDQFTVEFDIYPRHSYNSDKASYEFEIGFNDNRTLIARFNNGYEAGAYLAANWEKPNDESGSLNTYDNNVCFSYDSWHHVALSFNKRAMKVYVDGMRVVNIPNMKQPTSFWIWSYHKEALFKNFRVAKGAVPLYDRMMSDGKFITYGITFDIGKSTIKPESMGEINRIVTLMTENPTLKFSVEGHTDATGNAVGNQTLSEVRSKAIVDKLVEMGIASDRLSSSGKGQNSPIADNSTEEGRAKNRRVEFVKQ